VEQFSQLLSVNVQANRPSNLALGYRSLALQIINDFVFSSLPSQFKSIADENFDDPLTVATSYSVNWTVWFFRNFPKLQGLLFKFPRWSLALISDKWEWPYLTQDVSIKFPSVPSFPSAFDFA